MVAPILHGDLNKLAWISLAGGLLGWVAWRAGRSMRGKGQTTH